MAKVLVLNASFEPLNITHWRRAVVLLVKGKAESIEHNGKLLYPDFPLPSVIRLLDYVKIPYKEMPLTRRNILERDQNCCQYCHSKGGQLTLDHIIPRSRGGQDTWENLITACMKCNVKKGNRTPREANMTLLSKPRRPYNSITFEIVKHTKGNINQEWKKYVISLDN